MIPLEDCSDSVKTTTTGKELVQMITFSNSKMMTIVLVVLLLISSASAIPSSTVAQSLPQSAEVQVVGGSRCATAWGLGLALAAASLSPCGVLCASLAWYDLALIGAYCD